MIRLQRSASGCAAFGLRQLVDIATRALSPGTNDPTTAVQALDRIHDLLRRRLRAFLEDLAAVAPGARQSVLSDENAALVADAERGFRNGRDRAEAAEPSARGRALGSGTRSGS